MPLCDGNVLVMSEYFRRKNLLERNTTFELLWVNAHFISALTSCSPSRYASRLKFKESENVYHKCCIVEEFEWYLVQKTPHVFDKLQCRILGSYRVCCLCVRTSYSWSSWWRSQGIPCIGIKLWIELQLQIMRVAATAQITETFSLETN